MEGRSASLYALNRAKALLREGTITMSAPEIGYTRAGQQALSVSGNVSDALENQSVSVELSADELLSHSCDCRRFAPDNSL